MGSGTRPDQHKVGNRGTRSASVETSGPGGRSPIKPRRPVRRARQAAKNTQKPHNAAGTVIGEPTHRARPSMTLNRYGLPDLPIRGSRLAARYVPFSRTRGNARSCLYLVIGVAEQRVGAVRRGVDCPKVSGRRRVASPIGRRRLESIRRSSCRCAGYGGRQSLVRCRGGHRSRAW